MTSLLLCLCTEACIFNNIHNNTLYSIFNAKMNLKVQHKNGIKALASRTKNREHVKRKKLNRAQNSCHEEHHNQYLISVMQNNLTVFLTCMRETNPINIYYVSSFVLPIQQGEFLDYSSDPPVCVQKKICIFLLLWIQKITSLPLCNCID